MTIVNDAESPRTSPNVVDVVWPAASPEVLEELRELFREVHVLAGDQGEPVAVAREPKSGRAIGVLTVKLVTPKGLAEAFWDLRTFVAVAHRRTWVQWHLFHDAVPVLVERFRSGVDLRAVGIAVENRPIKVDHMVQRFLDADEWDVAGLRWSRVRASGLSHLRIARF